MSDLRESLMSMLDDEPAVPDIAGQVIVAGRRARTRRRVALGLTTAGTAAVVVAAVAVPLAVSGAGTHRTQSVTIAATPGASPTTSATPTARPTAPARAAGFGFNPTGPAPTCPTGQLPTVSADMAKIVVHGTYGANDQSWADQYVKPDPQLKGVGYSVAAVNGTPPTPATSYLWVLSGPASTNAYTASVLLERTSASTWAGHPATFTGCQPPSK
jgi:hypothetical protein